MTFWTFWINGKFRNHPAAIAIHDRGFLLGDGIFETFYVENRRAFEVEAHLQRLFASLDLLDMPCPHSVEELTEAIQTCLEKNNITLGSLRLTVSRGAVSRSPASRGPAPRGLLPPPECKATVLITCTPGDRERDTLPAINLAISPIRRNETSPVSQMKMIGGYLDNMLALQNARKAGFDDALLLNSKGHVACTTTANIFMQRKNIWQTPPLEDGILAGIQRQSFMQKLRSEGKTVLQKSITTDALKGADQIVITNSLIGIRPVQTIQDI